LPNEAKKNNPNGQNYQDEEKQHTVKEAKVADADGKCSGLGHD
jgi:hypothetical protein